MEGWYSVKASDAIASRAPKGPKPLTPAQRAELKLILEHNDMHTQPARKVGRVETLRVLADAGWHGSRLDLDRICQAEFKRHNFARK